MTTSPDPQNPRPALRVRNVSKTYRLWSTPGSRLWVPLSYRLANLLRFLPPLSRWLEANASSRVHYHRALSGINFELQRGEALGIVGHNGSGKSTLLQIVAGVLDPSSGEVEVNGRVAALLELGSGFNPELTGRENIRVNAAILGLSNAQVRDRMDDIIAFADIGDYIDEPVRTYSSGMALRLAFAVQVHTDPDILIVDEALAVGDAAFQAKAMARIDLILSRGTTLLFVGHDLNAVKAFCHRAMLLEKGRVVMEGLPDEVITEYLRIVHRNALEQRKDERASRLTKVAGGYGLTDACVVESSLNGGATHVALRHGDRVDVKLRIRLHAAVKHPQIIFDVMDGRGLQLTGQRISLQAQDGDVELELGFPAIFQQGVYRVRMRVVDSPSVEQTTVLSRQEGVLSFEVIDDCRERFTGLFPVPFDIRTT